MKIKIIPLIVLILGLINLFFHYNNIQQKGIKDLGLKIAILNEELTSQIKELESEISMLKEITTLNRYHEDLTDLTSFESSKFEEFRNNYDDEVLNGLAPISICKMYLHASLIKDYETQYEFYTTNENGWFWTKEEDEMIPSSDRISDFAIFEDIYNLNIDINGDNQEFAVINWNSKNGYIDDKSGALMYGFTLQKDKNIWKVIFMPMQ